MLTGRMKAMKSCKIGRYIGDKQCERWYYNDDPAYASQGKPWLLDVCSIFVRHQIRRNGPRCLIYVLHVFLVQVSFPAETFLVVYHNYRFLIVTIALETT